MQNGRSRFLAVLVLVVGTGCDSGTGSSDDDTGAVSSTDPSASGPDSSGPSIDGPNTGGPNPSVVSPSPVGPNGTSGDPGGPMNCTDVSPCGGSVVGTWNVTSSCLEFSGDMDVLLTSLACPTVPVTGSLQTTGTFVANADGSYADNTTTTGTVMFPLAPSCLAISGVAVECAQAGNIFSALGWDTTTCTDTDGQCNCVLSTEQEGGFGAVLSYTEPTGQYTTSGSTLTASNATYSYCAAADTLTVTPQMSGLTGTVVLQREGTGGGGAGGMTGTGGMAAAGGMMSGEGGMMSGEGGMMSGEGGMMSGGGAGGTVSGEGGDGGEPGILSLGPCDIYEAAGHTCVAAHSTVRALFGSYDGNLYQVQRADGTTQDIAVLSPGGFADSAQQDSFCGGSSCTITRVYDQSGHGNFLEAQTPDSTVGGNNGMTAANAAAERLTVGGHQVYSLFTRPSQAYWNDGSQSDMPLGAEPQAVYMVTSGEHYNGGCCYNYGNAQLDRNYHGGPTMDAVYFGNITVWGTGAGDGPWVMADMEDGIVSQGGPGQNPNSMSLPFPYVTAMEKNNGTTEFALKGADATNPELNTFYQGSLPPGKNPMQKEGAVIMGAGGDCCYSNNNASEGTFYEGAIVAGYPSDATDEEIHANVVEVGYGR